MIKRQEWICGLFLLLIPTGLFQVNDFLAYSQLGSSAQTSTIAESKPENEESQDEKMFEISLADIGMPEMEVLNGPYGVASFVFNLPKDWQLTRPAVLELHTSSQFYSFLEAFTEGTSATEIGAFGSSLEITLNEQTIERVPINQAGESAFTFEIPVSAFSESGETQTLNIGWDAALACQSSIASILKINPNSKLIFTYKLTEYIPTITHYPVPFIVNKSILPYSTAIILSPNPTEQELSALLAISAGLGKLSKGKLKYDLFTTEKMGSSDLTASNLILVGKFDSLSAALVGSALKFKIGELLNTLDDNSGLVFMDVSPLNPGRAMLIVTGRSDSAVIKASTALGVETILPYSGGQYAIITDVNYVMADSQYQIYQTLITLGSKDVISFEKLGETISVIPFEVPADISINPEAYLEIYFRHSQLLDYLRSTIEISINDVVIGNIRFNDQSNENGVVRFILPPNVIKPILNVLTIKAQLAAQDVCGDPRSGDYWAEIFGDSYLHLPPVIEGQNDSHIFYLSDFPLPFINDPYLKKSIFIVEQNDFNSWKKASEIAYSFGVQTHSNLFAPSVKYAGSFSSDNKAGNYIIIGLSNSIPFSAGINNILPLKYEQDGKWEKFDQPGISYDFDQKQDLGYLEFLPSNGYDGNIITILGNTQKGLDNAVKVIMSAASKEQLKSMNMAAITNDGLINSFFFQPTPLNGDEEAIKTGIENLILKPENFPIFLLIIILILICGLVLWPVLFRKKSEKE